MSSLYYANWVDIDKDADAPPAGRTCARHGKDSGEIEVGRGLEDDVDPVLSPDATDGTRHRPQHTDAGIGGRHADLAGQFGHGYRVRVKGSVGRHIGWGVGGGAGHGRDGEKADAGAVEPEAASMAIQPGWIQYSAHQSSGLSIGI